MKKKTKIILIIAAAIVFIITVAVIISIVAYNSFFNCRFDGDSALLYRVEDFDGLIEEKCRFESDKGQMLSGYMYSKGENQKGIIVMCHGYGAEGHRGQLNITDYFAEHGYYVFAYDATGTGESEGEGVGGLPQGVIDLSCAISLIEADPEYAEYPIMLFGHSWGGYNVCSVLKYHPEVKAVVECSGFNESSELIEVWGKDYAGIFVYAVLPFINLREQLTFGEYASSTALDGFAASDAAVIVLHSKDDTVVPFEYGYSIFYEEYADDPRFEFIALEDKGHSNVYEDTSYVEAFNAEFDEWLKTLDYDYTSSENEERFISDKEKYIEENLDRYEYSHNLNEELFERFTDFYDEHLS